MLMLVIGGAASGKSAYAEHLAVQSGGPRYYLATMQVWDAECAAAGFAYRVTPQTRFFRWPRRRRWSCLLYTSDAADE